MPFEKTMNSKELLSYCGQYSSLNVYPATSKLQINAFIHLQMYMIINATFSVLDKNTARSFQIITHKANLMSQTLFQNDK